MDFSLSEEQELTGRTVRDFARKEVAPVIKDADRRQEPLEWVLGRMGELGILGLPFPVRYGGQGTDYITLGLACEELEAITARVGGSVSTIAMVAETNSTATEEVSASAEQMSAQVQEVNAPFAPPHRAIGLADPCASASCIRRDGRIDLSQGYSWKQ